MCRTACPAVPVSCGNGGDGEGATMDAVEMCGAILLHEGAGGYVPIAVISVTAAAVITALCIKLRNRGQQGQDTEKENINLRSSL